jgi:hypothetical protein
MPTLFWGNYITSRQSCIVGSGGVADEASPGPRSVRHGRFGHCKNRSDAVGVADIEQHAFGNDAPHFSRWQVHHEKRLPALDLARIHAFFLKAGEDRAGVIAEVDAQLHEFVRSGHIAHGFDRTDAHVELFEQLGIYERLDCCGHHVVSLPHSPAQAPIGAWQTPDGTAKARTYELSFVSQRLHGINP